MGMSVKGVAQHRLVARGMNLLLADPLLDPALRKDCETLRRRADLGLARLKNKKAARFLRQQAKNAEAV